MPSPRFEIPVGAINGANTVFTVSMPYLPGSVAVFVNGLLMARTLDDGWFESDPSNGVVMLKEAPRSSGANPDVIQIFYIDTAGSLTSGQFPLQKVRGVLRAFRPMKAKVSAAQEIVGRTIQPSPMIVKIEPRKYLRAVVSMKQPLRAKIRMCG